MGSGAVSDWTNRITKIGIMKGNDKVKNATGGGAGEEEVSSLRRLIKTDKWHFDNNVLFRNLYLTKKLFFPRRVKTELCIIVHTKVLPSLVTSYKKSGSSQKDLELYLNQKRNI